MKTSAKIAMLFPVLALGLFLGHRPRLEACGPFYIQTVFQNQTRPDELLPFLQGDLGLLRPTFSRAFLVLAWRRMNGLSFPRSLQEASQHFLEDKDASLDPEVACQEWMEARKRVLSDSKNQTPSSLCPSLHYAWYVRIQSDAFRRACQRLKELEVQKDVQKQDLLSWVEAQDQVFASEKARPQIPPPVDKPAWLKTERDYQRASALFYAEDFDGARQAYGLLAETPHAPMRFWAGYLQARCLLRKATLHENVDSKALLLEAQALLDSILADSQSAQTHEAARRLRKWILHRTDPGAIAKDASEILASSNPEPLAFKTALRDLSEIKDAKTFRGSTNPQAPLAEDLLSWLYQLQEKPGAEAYEYCRKQWLSNRRLSWLFAAFELIPHESKVDPELVKSADNLASSHPAFLLFQWEALRFQRATLAPEKLRRRLEDLLRLKPSVSMTNALLALRREVARDLQDWGQFLGQRALCFESEEAAFREEPDPQHASVEWLDPECALILNQDLSLSQLVILSTHPSLPPPIKKALVRMIWVRASLLNQTELADRLASNLDSGLREQASTLKNISDPSARRFEWVRILMEFPGLSPEVDYGRGREAGLAEFDSLRNNWWCAPDAMKKSETFGAGFRILNTVPNLKAPRKVLPFLSKADLEQAADERRKVFQSPSAIHFFGETVLEFAVQHPEDERVPSALARFVALTRSPMCPTPELSALSKQAWRLLHKRYPQSPEAKKTPYAW